MSRQSKICECCKEPLVRREGERPYRFKKRRHCSLGCYNNTRAVENDVPKPCANCGKLFSRPRMQGQIEWDKRRFCSIVCATTGKNNPAHSHGLCRTKLYGIWSGIKTRCLNENDAAYKHYGGRGITVVPEWIENFEGFAEYMGDAPGDEYEIGRIDNERGYEPGNVRWETRKQQTRNTRRTLWVEFDERLMSLAEACEIAEAPYKKAWTRLRRGWSIERALQP